MKCPACQAENAAGARFCKNCGLSLQAAAPSRSAAAPVIPPAGPGPVQQVLRFLEYSSAEPTGLVGAVVIFVAVLLVNLITWAPLGWVPRTITTIVGVIVPNGCGVTRGFFFSLCSSALGLYSQIGPFLVVGALFVFRKALTAGLKRLLGLLPREVAFLGAPVLATLLFTMAWAGVGFHFFDRPGIVRDGLFPTVVGLISYFIARFDPALRRSLASLWESRDLLTYRVRAGVAALAVLLFSWTLTGRVDPPVRDQWVVIISLIVGYLLLAPRSGQGVSQ